MRRTAIVLIMGLAPLAWAIGVSAQVQVGPQFSLGTDGGAALGGRLSFPLRTGALGILGSIDASYFTGGGEGVDKWIEANANVRFPIPLAEDFQTRLGAGLNITHLSFEPIGEGATTRSETRAGLNVLGALEFPRGFVTPFAEFRVVATGPAQQLVATVGILFGRGQE